MDNKRITVSKKGVDITEFNKMNYLRMIKLVFVIVSTISLTVCIAQTEETTLDIKNGLYLNWGNTKLRVADTLRCFSFDNMMLRTELIDQMFNYDYITFLVTYVRPYQSSGFSSVAYYEPYSYYYKAGYSKKAFVDNFSNKTEASFWLIPPEDKKAHLFDLNNHPFSRAKLVNTSLKENEKATYLKIEIYAHNIESTSEVWNESQQKYRTVTNWSEQINLVNELNSYPIMILSQYHRKKRDYVGIDMSQECFPYSGENKISTPLE